MQKVSLLMKLLMGVGDPTKSFTGPKSSPNIFKKKKKQSAVPSMSGLGDLGNLGDLGLYARKSGDYIIRGSEENAEATDQDGEDFPRSYARTLRALGDTLRDTGQSALSDGFDNLFVEPRIEVYREIAKGIARKAGGCPHILQRHRVKSRCSTDLPIYPASLGQVGHW